MLCHSLVCSDIYYLVITQNISVEHGTSSSIRLIGIDNIMLIRPIEEEVPHFTQNAYLREKQTALVYHPCLGIELNELMGNIPCGQKYEWYKDIITDFA